MNSRLKSALVIATGVVCLVAQAARGADAIVPDLQNISHGVGAKLPTKGARWEPNASGRAALFTDGAIWLEGITFTDGTIECDILGKSEPRGSNFLGIAFRGADDKTYDCVYFRPFNFRAPNPENSSHAVQYISHPQWTWQKLRAEKTGRFEKDIADPPDGDAWFHAKIVVEGKKIRVFVNDAAKPSLEIETLNDRTEGRIAIWGGDAGNGGYFANLKITPRSP